MLRKKEGRAMGCCQPRADAAHTGGMRGTDACSRKRCTASLLWPGASPHMHEKERMTRKRPSQVSARNAPSSGVR